MVALNDKMILDGDKLAGALSEILSSRDLLGVDFLTRARLGAIIDERGRQISRGSNPGGVPGNKGDVRARLL